MVKAWGLLDEAEMGGIAYPAVFVIDRERMELRFLHLRKFTRGMKVIWTFKETPAGVLVEIMHALRFRVPALAPIAEPIIGGFFIHHVASQPLRCMKSHVAKIAASASQRS